MFPGVESRGAEVEEKILNNLYTRYTGPNYYRDNNKISFSKKLIFKTR